MVTDSARTHIFARRAALAGAAVAGALILTMVTAFVVVVSRELSPGDSQLILAAGFAALAVLILQLLLQLRIVGNAAAAERRVLESQGQLREREEQWAAVDRLTHALNTQFRTRRIAGTAIDFFVEEMGCASAVYWKPDPDGIPSLPMLARSVSGEPDNLLHVAEPQRVILVSNAVRDAVSYVVPASGTPRPLGRERPDDAEFTMLLPLWGSERCEGVLEVRSAVDGLEQRHWDALESFCRHIAIALERGRRFEETQEQADMDFVTGLYNQRFMQVYLHNTITAAASRGRPVCVILMDVDNFKAFNDNLGHNAGDRVLQTVADQLKHITDREGLVGRSGGDEFMVVLPNKGRGEAQAMIQAFEDWLSISSPVNGLFRIHVSCGLAVFPEDADSRQELLAVADARLYQAKSSGERRRRSTSERGRRKQDTGSTGIYGLLDRMLDGLDKKDNFTRRHCEKTAEYALALASQMALSPQAQKALRLAALLHDVGKIGIPHHILSKPGKLTTDEFEIIKHQVRIAEYLIVDVPNAEEVRSLVRASRERWDGKGYLNGLKGEQIPYLARLLAVASTYAAITLDRPYRRALPPAEAYVELQGMAGAQLDPTLVKAFGEITRRKALTRHPDTESAFTLPAPMHTA